MNDLFSEKTIKPMLIGLEAPPFDDAAFIYELKVDGERCLAYLDPAEGTDLRNKRGLRVLPRVPELAGLHENVNRRCILDGELAVITDGKPDFFAIQRRILLSSSLKIQLAARQHPACFVAFDLLYLDDHPVNDLPLMERKRLLEGTAVREDARFAVSRYVERGGVAFFELAKAQELEGIVAKRRDSRYYFGKRTRDWIKSKVLQDEDFVVCGYQRKANSMNSVILGQYQSGQLVCKGHVTLGVGGESLRRIRELPVLPAPPFDIPVGSEDAFWVIPDLVCTVRYMMKTGNGGMRQSVFKGLRDDKAPEECVDHG